MNQLPTVSFLFDLDGTLIDSVYQHVLAWHEALEEVGIKLSVWRIHRKIGMSGGLFASALLRETGQDITDGLVDRLQRLHAEAYVRRSHEVGPLPGACELLRYLTEADVPWAIATSSRMETAKPTLAALGVDRERVPVVTRDQVRRAKPDPDLFFAAAERLSADITHPWSWATASGTCSPLAALMRWASGCCPAATGWRNLSAPERTASTRIRRICCGTSTRSGCAQLDSAPGGTAQPLTWTNSGCIEAMGMLTLRG